jgi:hypothetical protein
LYEGDFDKNGRTDQLLSYTANGIEYPFLAKDEVERSLPLLKKHYLYYSEYAGVPMKDVFYGWIDSVKPQIAERLGSAIFYGNGKGGFSVVDLPIDLQLAPVFSFQKINNAPPTENRYLLGGNFFGVIPYEGRYDAQPLALFGAHNNSSVHYILQANLSQVKGEVRDIKWLHTAKYGEVMMIARNNDSIIFLSEKK